MYLEHYDSAGTLKAAHRADRVDFWDNGYQQLSWYDTDLVVQKGESLQTHCYFDTTQRTASSNFGSGTPDEMCMQFALYYPIRTKGVDSSNDPVLFGDCGGRISGGQALTMCGGPTQTGGQFVAGGQVDRGNARYTDTTIVDANFGAAPAANSLGAAANGQTGVDTCTFNPPSPPPAAPPPALPPGAPGASAVSVVTFVATVAGTVEAFDTAGYKTKLATFLGGGVTASDITLTVTAASVKVTAEIVSSSAATAAALSAKIDSSSTAALTSALGVTVESKLAASVEQKLVAPPPPASGGALIAAIVGSIGGVLVLAGIVFFVVRRRRAASAAAGAASGPEVMTKTGASA